MTMWTHLAAIIGLVLLCAVWVIIQLWMKHLDPESNRATDECSGCGPCGCKPSTRKDVDKGDVNCS